VPTSDRVKQIILLGPLDAEDEGITVLWNIGDYSPSDTEWHPRKCASSTTLLWQPQILLQTCISCPMSKTPRRNAET